MSFCPIRSLYSCDRRWWWHFVAAVDEATAMAWRGARPDENIALAAVDYSFSVSFWWGKRILKE